MYNQYEIDGFKIDYFDFSDSSLETLKNYLEKYLTLDEKEKIEKYQNENDYKLHLIGKVYPKVKLAKILNKSPLDIAISYDENGKPFYKDYQNYYFSLSYSYPYFVFIIHNKPIGIDVERRRVRDFKALNYVCNEQEIAEAKDFDDKFMLWTFKEAYAKWTGEGLSKKLKDISYNSKDFYTHTLFINHVIISIVSDKKNI